jgi:hypothetical protein
MRRRLPIAQQCIQLNTFCCALYLQRLTWRQSQQRNNRHQRRARKSALESHFQLTDSQVS